MQTKYRQNPGSTPVLVPLMFLEAQVAPELTVARPGIEARLAIVYFTGGQFEGDRLSGVVLPGGGDWADCRSADHVEIDVRAVLRTHDDALIYLKYQGIWCAPPGVLPRVLATGGDRHFDPSQHYFRTSARFETADKRYMWLNRIIALGFGARTPAGVGHDFFEVA